MSVADILLQEDSQPCPSWSNLNIASLEINGTPVPAVTAQTVTGTWVSADFTSSPAASVAFTQIGGVTTVRIAGFSAATASSTTGAPLVLTGATVPAFARAALGNSFWPMLSGAAGGGYVYVTVTVGTGGALSIYPYTLSSATWATSISPYTFYPTAFTTH